MGKPFPGSSDEYHEQKRVRRKVNRAIMRGERLSSPEEARLAVEIARENLAGLPRERRRALIGAVPFVVLVGLHILIEDTFFAVAFAVIGVLWLVAALALERVLRPRYERAIELNSET